MYLHIIHLGWIKIYNTQVKESVSHYKFPWTTNFQERYFPLEIVSLEGL